MRPGGRAVCSEGKMRRTGGPQGQGEGSGAKAWQEGTGRRQEARQCRGKRGEQVTYF